MFISYVIESLTLVLLIFPTKETPVPRGLPKKKLNQK